MDLLAIVGGAWLVNLCTYVLIAEWAIQRNRKDAGRRRAMRRWLGSDCGK